jgi:ATP-dependent Zn protease
MSLLVAIHEAGHTCIGLLLGLEVVDVTIAPNNRADAAGVTTFANFGEVYTSDRIKTMLAGLIAERRAGGVSWDQGCKSDCDEVSRQMAAGLDLGQLILATDDLVRKHWSRIEKLADALLDRQTLTGADVREILGR